MLGFAVIAQSYNWFSYFDLFFSSRTSQKKDAWEMECQQTATFTGYHRNHSPALYGQGSITVSKNDKYPLGFSGTFPEEGRRGSLLSPAYSAEEIKLSVSNYFPVTQIHLLTNRSPGGAKN